MKKMKMASSIVAIVFGVWALITGVLTKFLGVVTPLSWAFDYFGLLAFVLAILISGIALKKDNEMGLNKGERIKLGMMGIPVYIIDFFLSSDRGAFAFVGAAVVFMYAFKIFKVAMKEIKHQKGKMFTVLLTLIYVGYRFIPLVSNKKVFYLIPSDLSNLLYAVAISAIGVLLIVKAILDILRKDAKAEVETTVTENAEPTIETTAPVAEVTEPVAETTAE